MALQLDPKLTKELQDWLNAMPNERDLMAGAQLLLKLNRNRAFYNTVIRNPNKYAEKIEYELRKILRVRLDNLTMAQVIDMEKKIMPSAQQIIDTANEMPEAKKAKGRRPDHDSLPEHIRFLWDENFTYYKQINLLFEELKAMNTAQPCDRYDKLQLLAAADAKYRSNLAKYDDYVVGSEQEQQTKTPISEEAVRRMNAARKTISKYRARIAKGKNLTDEKRAAAIEALQRNVNVVIECGGKFTLETKQELTPWGITFELNA